MLVQHHPTLLDATCWPCLNTKLEDVGLSTRSAFETPAKRTRMKAKSPAHREWKVLYEIESIKSYTASGCLEISKRISHKISE